MTAASRTRTQALVFAIWLSLATSAFVAVVLLLESYGASTELVLIVGIFFGEGLDVLRDRLEEWARPTYPERGESA